MAALPTLNADNLPRLDAPALLALLGPLNILGEIKYTVIDPATGAVKRVGTASNLRDALADAHEGDELAIGHPEVSDEPVVTEYDIRRYATALIEQQGYKAHDQIEILGSGDVDRIETMRSDIARIVERSRVLREISPLPTDYRDPKYWT